MHRAARQPLFWLVILAASAVAGLVYNRIIGGGEPTVAAVRGILMAAPLLAFESGWILPGWQQYVRRLPTLLAVPAAEATYIVLIASGFAASGLLLWGVGGLSGPWLEAVTPSLRVLLYALLVSAAIVSVIRIRDLIGSEVFFSLLVGRYHRPVREERVFLFIDIVGSTRYAEAHGDLRAQEFLGAFFAALAEPVRRHEGSVDDYVGDMALVTWPLRRGVKDAQCIGCVFALQDAIARTAGAWSERFGTIPRFRAALHAGPVVTAEVGVDRHKIAYFGDTVNATGRLEALCRELSLPVLISADLLDRVPALPPGIVAERLGEKTVRGRDRALAVAALHRSEDRATEQPEPRHHGSIRRATGARR
jgi:adenylate cyclase